MGLSESVNQGILVVFSLLLASFLVLPLKLFGIVASGVVASALLIYVLSESWVTSEAN